MVLAIWGVAGRIGFSVLDEGMIASYSRRILNGEVPHRDIVSVRPLGSALLHVVDLAIPLPLFTTIRLMGLAEVVAYSVLFATFILRRGLLRWTATESVVVATTVLVNIHTFPLMTWYTIDGLLFTGAGLVLAQRAGDTSSRRAELAAMLCLGAAVAVKQSFFAAPLLGVLILWRARPGARWLPAAVRRLAFAAIPGLLYLIWLTVAGALPDALRQLTAGRPVYGRSLFEAIGVITTPADRRAAFSGHFPFEVVVPLLALLVAERRKAARRLVGPARAVVALAVVYLTLSQTLGYVDAWALELTWALVALVALVRVFRGHWSVTALTVLVLAWMTMLSWGHEVPSLVGGTVALCLVSLALGQVDRLDAGRAGLLAATVAFVVVAVVFVHARRDSPYYDRPEAQLTYDLGRIDRDLTGIRTNQVTGQYVAAAARCIKRYPADSVAILPDNPGLYAALGLISPFPLDWVIRGDYAGATAKIVRAAERLERQGNYLVLFQVVSGLELSRMKTLPRATRADSPVMLASPIYDPPLARRIIDTLDGRHIVCGPFLGVYEPNGTQLTGGSSSTGEPPRRSDSPAASRTATT